MYFYEPNITSKLRNRITRGVGYTGPVFDHPQSETLAGTLTMELGEDAIKLSVRLNSTPREQNTGIWVEAPFTDVKLAMALGESAGFALAKTLL